MFNVNSVSLIWRRSTNQGNTVGNSVSLPDGCTASTPDLTGGSLRERMPRTRFTRITPGIAGIILEKAVGWTGGVGWAGGLSVTLRFALGDGNASRGFVGLCDSASPVVESEDGVPAAPNTIGIGFDDDNLPNGNWHLIAASAEPIDLGLPRSTTAVLQVKIIVPSSSPAELEGAVLLIVQDLATGKLVTGDIVPGVNTPAANTQLFLQVQTASDANATAIEIVSIDVAEAANGVFDVREFGATGDATTDDQPAFQAALWAASRFVNVDRTAAGGTRVVVPPGRYRMAAPLVVMGAVSFEGVQGSGSDGTCTLIFDENVGAPSNPEAHDYWDDGCLILASPHEAPIPPRDADRNYKAGDLIVPVTVWNGGYYRCIAVAGDQKPKPNVGGMPDEPIWSTAFGETITDGDVTWTFWGWLPSAQGAIVKNLALEQKVGDETDYLKPSTGVRLHVNARLQDLFIRRFQGTGIHIYGWAPDNICSLWSFGGTIRVWDCGRYGMQIHGPDASTGTAEGVLDLTNNASFGLHSGGMFGNLYCNIHTNGNGAFLWNAVENAWQLREGPPFPKKWTDLPTVVRKGTVCLPSTNGARSGFQYCCVKEGKRGNIEPTWSDHKVILAGRFPDGPHADSCEWQCWMEEGGPIHTEPGLALNVFLKVYAEMDQAPLDLTGGDVVLALNSEMGLTLEALSALPRLTTNHGFWLPITIFPMRQEAWEDKPQRVMQLDLGSAPGTYIAWKFAANLLADHGESWKKDFYWIQKAWDPALKRWREQAGPFSADTISYTQCGGRSAPQAGAYCFLRLWVGGQFGEERQITFVPSSLPGDNPSFVPAIEGYTQVWGLMQPGDVFINQRRSYTVPPNGVDDGTTPDWPFAWRPKSSGGKEHDATWKGEYPYQAGFTLLVDGIHLFRAREGGMSNDHTTGGPSDPPDYQEPDWNTIRAGGLGATYTEALEHHPNDVPVTWEYIGEKSVANADFWEPIIPQSCLLGKIELNAAHHSTTLKFWETAFERLKLTGNPGAISVIVPPGPARGWSRIFWNQTDEETKASITIKASSSDPGVPVPWGEAWHLISDDTTCVHVT